MTSGIGEIVIAGLAVAAIWKIWQKVGETFHDGSGGVVKFGITMVALFVTLVCLAILISIQNGTL